MFVDFLISFLNGVYFIPVASFVFCILASYIISCFIQQLLNVKYVSLSFIIKQIIILVFLSVLTTFLSFIYFIYTASGTFIEITFFLYSYILIVLGFATFFQYNRLFDLFRKIMGEYFGDSEILYMCNKLKAFAQASFYVLYAVSAFFLVFGFIYFIFVIMILKTTLSEAANKFEFGWIIDSILVVATIAYVVFTYLALKQSNESTEQTKKQILNQEKVQSKKDTQETIEFKIQKLSDKLMLFYIPLKINMRNVQKNLRTYRNVAKWAFVESDPAKSMEDEKRLEDSINNIYSLLIDVRALQHRYMYLDDEQISYSFEPLMVEFAKFANFENEKITDFRNKLFASHNDPYVIVDNRDFEDLNILLDNNYLELDEAIDFFSEQIDQIIGSLILVIQGINYNLEVQFNELNKLKNGIDEIEKIYKKYPQIYWETEK
ncbi:hypothetical protein MmiHf6_17290 [Methanimicrococcus hongohii]|uniref:Uncharacterized protein n=1 Tax=Methanimicrococcus hongohii TaxID=3028295 RepID=A0AA97A2U7_9EURY|nr:hypothetical protein [Methanimicrococcus sp. Hf6]WNY24398.1 hypothetical protein MmiHf6_17290 [Methanimicrococcus sp. Hf6]